MQARLARDLQLISPVQAYYALASKIAGTDLQAYLQFVQHADRYQEQVANWHRRKISQYPQRESQWSSGFGLLDMEGFPQPPSVSSSMIQKVASSLVYFSLLIAFNGITVFAVLLAINRYDPR